MAFIAYIHGNQTERYTYANGPNRQLRFWVGRDTGGEEEVAVWFSSDAPNGLITLLSPAIIKVSNPLKAYDIQLNSNVDVVKDYYINFYFTNVVTNIVEGTIPFTYHVIPIDAGVSFNPEPLQTEIIEYSRNVPAERIVINAEVDNGPVFHTASFLNVGSIKFCPSTSLPNWLYVYNPLATHADHSIWTTTYYVNAENAGRN